MAKDISEESVEKAYARWAPVYDVVFGKVFEPGRKASIAAADKIGGRILDVGVGTGISLPDYRRDIRLVGIDYSAAMLKKARRRVIEQKLDHVETLAVIEAKSLGFPEAFFDAVVAQYVVPAVPDPEATLDEFVRVTKPGGEIILANHIGAEKGPRKVFEAGFSPIARRLGWRPEFSGQRLVDWAARNNNVRLVERLPLPPMGHFSLIRYARIA
jgi:phosphatidylethanolamine/phosphatidyl-N-methylethanolamine N-methyltransferase